MREITTHHDGHGLAESIKIRADEIPDDPRFGGASHHYVAFAHGPNGYAIQPAALQVQFQKGPRNVEGSTPGVIDTVLLAIVEDRLNSFQGGPFPSDEGAMARYHVREAMKQLKLRADVRARRGVLGKAEK